MLRGSQPATVDDKGRIKIPTSFRKTIHDAYGAEVFLTSLDGKSVSIYPLPIWEEFEQKISSIPTMNPSRQRLLDRVSYYGHAAKMDKQGRVLVPQRLREEAQITGEVLVMGKMKYLDVWNHEVFRQERLGAEPLDEQDLRELAELGI